MLTQLKGRIVGLGLAALPAAVLVAAGAPRIGF